MTTHTPTTIDQETAERLSAEFHRCFSHYEARDDLFAPDTFFDLLPPLWRFQIEGPGEAFTTQLRSIALGPSTSRSFARSRPPRASSPSTWRPSRPPTVS